MWLDIDVLRWPLTPYVLLTQSSSYWRICRKQTSLTDMMYCVYHVLCISYTVYIMYCVYHVLCICCTIIYISIIHLSLKLLSSITQTVNDFSLCYQFQYNYISHSGRLRGLAVACWTTDHYHPCSNPGVGISEGGFVFHFVSLHLEVARPI